MPRPRTAMIVLAEPMSMAMESDTKFLSALRPRNEPVLLLNDMQRKK